MNQRTRLYAAITLFVCFLLLLPALPARAALLPPPAGLNALAGNSEASLTWNAVPGAESYILYRRNSVSGPYVCVARTVAKGFGDRGLVNGTTYHYPVSKRCNPL